MTDTRRRWLTWIATNAKYIFTGVWGAGFGAFGLVITKTVDMTGITPPIYLGVLSVMMGGALGLLTSRSMDGLVDHRKRERKIQTARAAIMRMSVALATLETAIRHAKEDLPGAPFDVSILMEFIQDMAQSPPDFDDVLESDADVVHAAVLNNIYMRYRMIQPRPITTSANAATASGIAIANEVDPAGLADSRRVLADVVLHFATSNKVTVGAHS